MYRREFVGVVVAGAGSLIVAACVGRPRGAPGTAGWSANAFVRIDADNTVTITVARAELGQGSRTALAMLVAEELEVPWESVRVIQGDLDPRYGEQFVGGSAVVRTSWRPLRQAGATARTLLEAAAAARWGVPATECRGEAGQVTHTDSGRRARYGELVDDARRLTPPEEVKLKEPADFRLIGQPRRSVDLPDIVTGRIGFGSDVRRPGQLVAVIERAPVFGGRYARIEDGAARAVPGVKAVIAVDADAMAPFAPNNPKPANGVAVLATTTWAALEGRRVLGVEWDPRGGEHDGTEAMRTAAVRLARQPDRWSSHRGRALESALKGSARRLEAVYETPLLYHAQMEPMICTADVRSDACEIWAPCQNPVYVQRVAAQLTGLPDTAITVHVTRMGGGFGRRFYADYAAEAVVLSRDAKRPVQVFWTREDDLRHGFYRPAGYHLLRGGIDAAGGITAWEHRLLNASRGEYLGRTMTPGGERDPGELSVDDYPSVLGPSFRIGYRPLRSRIPRGQWRAVESSSNVFVVQSFMDEVALLAGADPLAYRLALYDRWRESLDPESGYEPERLLGVLRLAGERSGWDRALAPPRGRGIAVHYGNQSYVAQVVELTRIGDREVRVDRVVSVVDCGIVVHPEGAAAQVEGSAIQGLSVAFGEEITVREGRVEQGNFDSYPLIRIHQVPPIDVHFVPGSTALGGLGEPALPPLLPAVTNALVAAGAERIRRLPLSRAGFRLGTAGRQAG